MFSLHPTTQASLICIFSGYKRVEVAFCGVNVAKRKTLQQKTKDRLTFVDFPCVSSATIAAFESSGIVIALKSHTQLCRSYIFPPLLLSGSRAGCSSVNTGLCRIHNEAPRNVPGLLCPERSLCCETQSPGMPTMLIQNLAKWTWNRSGLLPLLASPLSLGKHYRPSALRTGPP